jgi:anti-sigma-K factor RskA
MREAHVLDQLADYVMDCLEIDERQAVDLHLAGCEVCRAELHALQEAAGQLVHAVQPVNPPARVRKTIMRRASPLAAWLKSRRPEGRGGMTRWLQSVSPAWATVSLVLILALVVSNLLMWNQLKQLTNPNQVQMRTVALVSTQSLPGATGLLVITGSGRYGTLVVDGLPQLDSQHQYQLWLIMGGTRTNGGLFTVDSDGYGAMVIESPLPLTNYLNFGVTVEPVGGSPGPTSQPILTGHL